MLCDEQYDLDHRVSFTAGERSVLPGGTDSALHPTLEPPSIQGAPMASTSMEEAWVMPIPTGGGPSHEAESTTTKPNIVSMEELPPTASKPPIPVTVRRMQTDQPRGFCPSHLHQFIK